MMHILVVDDEALARQRLIKMLATIAGYEVVGEAATGDEALAAVEQCDPDLVLMDIRMPGLDGMAAAHAIAQLQEPPAMIFCTAYDEYAIEAFDAQAIGYLVKPVSREKLIASLEKTQRLNKVQRAALVEAQASRQAPRKHILAKTRQGIELVPIDSVYCFIADQKYVSIIHHQGETLIDDTLKDLEHDLRTHFLRVHRNALVAVNRIAALQKSPSGHYRVLLKDCPLQPMVSRRHLAKVKALLQAL